MLRHPPRRMTYRREAIVEVAVVPVAADFVAAGRVVGGAEVTETDLDESGARVAEFVPAATVDGLRTAVVAVVPGARTEDAVAVIGRMDETRGTAGLVVAAEKEGQERSVRIFDEHLVYMG